MRNTDRLDDFYKELCNLHKTSFPNWRFGQLCSNFFSWLMVDEKVDLFFPEEDDMIEYLREYVNSLGGKNK